MEAHATVLCSHARLLLEKAYEGECDPEEAAESTLIPVRLANILTSTRGRST